MGSGAVMHQTGPAAILSYLAAGLLVVLVMRMLGEMAVANPKVGSFLEYCREALGPWAGFTVGWLYWYFLAAIWPEPVFLWLVNSSGAVALFCYVLIACAELRTRRKLERDAPERLQLRMWLYPSLTYASIAAMVAVIGAMALVDDVRAQLWWSLGLLAVVLGLAFWHTRRREEPHAARARGGAAVPGR